jgi:PTH1 family peptidyl-tRNA hydrolase
MENLHLIVGLGNPGADYARTRHNAGFLLAERLAGQWGAVWRSEDRFQARLAAADPEGRRCMLCEPLTYMNASGVAVAAVAAYYRVALARLLVLVDDADLPLGEIRLRARGSSGGHHGLESIEQQLGSRGYPRLRMGIGRRAADGRQISGHVLSRFSREETAVFELALARAAEQAACWVAGGIDLAMNKFNGVVAAPETKEH